jgi:transposase
MAGKKREEPTMITLNGEVMSVEERNRRMKLEFVNGGLSLKELADKYGLSYNTVRVMSCNGKWADYRRAFESKVAKEAEEQLEEIYVATKVEVNLNYNNLWEQMMLVAKRMLATSEGILDKDGQISVYKLNQLADIITKCHQGQMVTTGFITKETQAKLDLEYRKMNIQEMLAGIGEDDVIPDNFLDALEAAAKRNFKEDK